MAEMTIEQMRAKVQEHDMVAMTARQAETDAVMKPLKDFTTGKTLAAVNKELEELAVVYAKDVTVSQKINALRMALSLFA